MVIKAFPVAGDVVGPASSTNSNFAAFDGTTGKLLKDSGVGASTIVAQTITNGVTTSAPSQDAVFDALALKQDLNGATFYDVTITQAAAAAPVATVLNKTIAGTLTWARTSVGVYTLTSNGTPFTANKTQIFVGRSVVTAGDHVTDIVTTRTSTSVITLNTFDVNLAAFVSTPTDDLLLETAFRIVIYP